MNLISKIMFALTLSALSLPLAAIPDRPKNIIYVIGDGMGPTYTTAYRYFMDDPQTAKVETTVFDQMLVGMSSTYASGTQEHHRRKTYVTDSAAAATALSTGIKTYNQAVAIDPDDKPLTTLMEHAKKIGKKTGLVVTSHIYHATPAAFVVHNDYRYDYNAIADSFFDNRVDGQLVVDLMFGGGTKHFIRPDRNIARQFIAAGYQYFDNYQYLGQFKRLPALGLFSAEDLGQAIDSPDKYRLRQMTAKALELLDNNEQGYLLLVEGSLIDWCGHNKDIGCAMAEMDDLAKAVEYLKHYADQNPDTLIVMTADHSTGGLSIGADNQYLWNAPLVKKIKHSMDYVSHALLKSEPDQIQSLWQQLVGIDINKTQLDSIVQIRKSALKAINEQDNKLLAQVISEQQQQITKTLAAITAEITFTGWTTNKHTGGDVQVFAYGPGQELFYGHQDNTDIAKKLFTLLNPNLQTRDK